MSLLTKVVTITIVVSVECIAGAATLKERVQNEAPRKWAQYLAWGSHVEGTCRFIQTDNLKGEVNLRNVCDFYVHAPYSLVVSGRVRDTDEAQWIVGGNTRYGFSLKRNATNAWYADSLDWHANTAGVQSNLPERSKALGPPAPLGTALGASCRAFLISNTWLNEVFHESGFKVTEVTEVTDGGESVVRVGFDYTPEIERNVPARDGMAILDPSRFWLPRKVEVRGEWAQGKYTGRIKVENEYLDGQFDVPILARQMTHVTVINREGRPHSDYSSIGEYEYRILSKTKDEDYMLRSFGLPEPRHLTESRWPVATICLNAVLVIALAFAVCIRAWARRRARMAAGNRDAT